MPIINYKFADGHTEELEVTEAVAAAFEQLEKYEKRSNARKHGGTFLMRDLSKAASSSPTKTKIF